MNIALAGLFAGVIALDQATKWFIKNSMHLGQSVPILGDTVRITFVENDGIAFGLHIASGKFFTVLSAAACALIVAFFWKHRRAGNGLRSGLLLILGGAVGNLVDRIAFGRVVDFVDVGVRHIRWPVFNIADSAVVIGTGIVLAWMIREDRKHNAHPAQSSSP